MSLNKRQRLRKEAKNPLLGFINQRIEGVPISVATYQSKARLKKQFAGQVRLLSPLEKRGIVLHRSTSGEGSQ